MSEKRAYTFKEFAALFGHERTWTYRQRDLGRIKVITEFGRQMVPHSEVAKIEAGAATQKSKGDDGASSDKAAKPAKKNPASRDWNDWVKAKKTSGLKKGRKIPGPTRK